MSLNLNPDIEARLIGLAQASGISVEDFLQHMVEEKVAEANASAPDALSPAERARAWREGVRGLPDTAPLSDKAISRESIYSHRD